jgi:hypothetical protein
VGASWWRYTLRSIKHTVLLAAVTAASSASFGLIGFGSYGMTQSDH